ncbi:hypothetical protein CTAYLR_010127 [Chrysophaeum taylorii]|uniref:Uncharacterized protein n=1 Tax=Chrysophaeum taylorii TaxID=2483200 RepID=A0AAD7U7X6_9STRA|nr:hypothetical protein CTAYLR_010127 [Chrysophaeum taylorii]
MVKRKMNVEHHDLSSRFSPHEHELFVEGIELYCKMNGGEAVWRDIASHVRTRTPEEVKAHAQYYLMSLQSRNPDVMSMAGTWTPAWSAAENDVFENALANFDEGDADRWHKIAALLPGKSPADVQQWYERLLGDMLEIERGARSPY